MTDPVFDQIIPADGWLAEYLIGPANAPTGRVYERVVAFVLGRFPSVIGEPHYQRTVLAGGIDGFDSQRRLCSTLPGFNRFVRFEDLPEEQQQDFRILARRPRLPLQVNSPEWKAMMDYGVATPVEGGQP